MPPATSKRQQILEYIIATLLPSITAGSSYNFTLKIMERGWRHPDNLLESEYPAVFIPTSHEKRENLTVGGSHGQYAANPMEVIFVGYVRNSDASPNGSGSEAKLDMDKLIADLTKAVELDPLLGGLCTNSEITDVAEDEGDKVPVAGFVMKVDYQYVTEGQTP